MKRSIVVIGMFAVLFCLSSTKAMDMEWVYISDPGVTGHEGFTGYMSKYETTNAQYCEFLNAAKASGDIEVDTINNIVLGANGSNTGEDFVGQLYYDFAGPGDTYDGAINGGSARINWTGSTFTVDSGFENHPVTYVNWYGATAFCNYYGYRLPTEWEWQAVADYDGSYTYGCGMTIDTSIANILGSNHPDGTTIVGTFGAYGYGICDMAGNLYEWTSSCYYADCSGGRRVGRSGAWADDVQYCAVSSRYYGDPNHLSHAIGFRVCLGLIAYYKLDDTSGAVIDETGNHDGTNYGATRGLTGADGKAFSFDGVNDYVSVPDNDALDFTEESVYSITLWLKGSYIGGPTYFIQKRMGDDRYAIAFGGDGSLTAQIGDGTNVLNAVVNEPIDYLSWHHIVMTYTNNNTLKLYVDGILKKTETLPLLGGVDTGTSPLLIGTGVVGTFQGLIDEVRIYDCALNGDEIQALYASAYGHYHVDGIHGNNGNDGLSQETAFATVQYGIGQSDDLDTIHVWPGVYNEAVDFLGKTITVQSAADAAVITNPSGYGVRFHTAEGLTSVLKNMIIRDCVIGVQAESSFPKIEYLTVVDNTQGIVADGAAEPNISNSIVWGNTSGGLIDCDASYSWIQDQLADNVDGLVAYYPFDGDAADASGNGHDGTINGAVSTIGKCGGALSFDGVDDSVSVPDDDALDFTENSNYSIALWLKSFSNSTVYFIEKREGNNRYGIALRDDSRLSAQVGDGTNVLEIVCEPMDFLTWHYVAMTYTSDNTLKLYIDGIIMGTSTAPLLNGVDTGTAPLLIGAGVPGTFLGIIDDVQIYNLALAETEIQQQYARSALAYGLGDPIFANPNSNDFHLRSEDGRFFAAPAAEPNMFGEGIDGAWVMDPVTSPCIDAGNSADNPSSERMPNGGRVNMGAYGGTAYASMSEYPLAGDINRDGAVNLADLAILSMDWLKTMPWFE